MDLTQPVVGKRSGLDDTQAESYNIGGAQPSEGVGGVCQSRT